MTERNQTEPTDHEGPEKEWEGRTLEIGALARPIHEQIGLDADVTKIEQRAVDSFNYLRIHGYLGGMAVANGCNEVIARMIKRLLKEGYIRRKD